jgi:hypothetical protein
MSIFPGPLPYALIQAPFKSIYACIFPPVMIIIMNLISVSQLSIINVRTEPKSPQKLKFAVYLMSSTQTAAGHILLCTSLAKQLGMWGEGQKMNPEVALNCGQAVNSSQQDMKDARLLAQVKMMCIGR